VGIWGVGIMNSTAFSLLANSNLEVDGNQEMELMIGSLNFLVRSSGSTRLSDPAKLDPSASKVNTIAMSGSSVRSSSEVNSPVSYTIAENTGEKIEELDETMEKLDIGEIVDLSYPSQNDFITRNGGISGNIHQLCVIITEAVEDNDPADNAATHVQVNKSRSKSKKGKGENSRFHRRVENHHVGHQPWHRGTRQFEKGSLDGVPVCPASAQKEATGGKRQYQEKSRK
jgi:hypothetical protein